MLYDLYVLYVWSGVQDGPGVWGVLVEVGTKESSNLPSASMTTEVCWKRSFGVMPSRRRKLSGVASSGVEDLGGGGTVLALQGFNII